jgi:hypothetical protein
MPEPLLWQEHSRSESGSAANPWHLSSRAAIYLCRALNRSWGRASNFNYLLVDLRYFKNSASVDISSQVSLSMITR